MGRTRQRSQERAFSEVLSEAVRAGFEEGVAQTFERILIAAARRVLGLEVRDVSQAVEGGPEEAQNVLRGLADSAWPERWRGALEGILAALSEQATQDVAPIFGSFDLSNPRMAAYFDNYVSELSQTLSETSYENAGNVIREAQEEGASIPDVRRKLEERLPELNRSRAELIARTEVIRSSNGAALIQAKESGLVVGKTWLATKDTRTRPEHRALDGTTVGIDEEFPNGLQHPGEPNCRCTLTWELSEEVLGGAA